MTRMIEEGGEGGREGGRETGEGRRMREGDTYSSVLVVYHDIVWFYISVHDAHAVAVVQSSQQLVQVIPDVIV